MVYYVKKLGKSQRAFQGIIHIKPLTEEVDITFRDVKYEIGEEIRVNERKKHFRSKQWFNSFR